MKAKDKELKHKAEQVAKCVRLIREVESLRNFSRSLGDDITDALDNLDAHVEEKLQGYFS